MGSSATAFSKASRAAVLFPCANFTSATLRRTDFSNADLEVEVAVLADGKAREWPPRFSGCKLEETNFKDVKASRIIATNAVTKKIIADEAFLKLLAAGSTA